jgi:hypothetical protein
VRAGRLGVKNNSSGSTLGALKIFSFRSEHPNRKFRARFREERLPIAFAARLRIARFDEVACAFVCLDLNSSPFSSSLHVFQPPLSSRNVVCNSSVKQQKKKRKKTPFATSSLVTHQGAKRKPSKDLHALACGKRYPSGATSACL